MWLEALCFCTPLEPSNEPLPSASRPCGLPGTLVSTTNHQQVAAPAQLNTQSGSRAQTAPELTEGPG